VANNSKSQYLKGRDKYFVQEGKRAREKLKSKAMSKAFEEISRSNLFLRKHAPMFCLHMGFKGHFYIVFTEKFPRKYIMLNTWRGRWPQALYSSDRHQGLLL